MFLTLGEYCLRNLETAQDNARRLSKQPELILPFPECCEAKPLAITECAQCGVSRFIALMRLLSLNLI